jgi:isopenicillin-N epimerase
VDGAHGPGQIPLDLAALGADVYAGNCHKWLCAPKGSGFLWVRPEHQEWVAPTVVSWGWRDDADFAERHGWAGTRDVSAYLTLPKAIEVHATFDSERQRAVADLAEARLAELGLARLPATPASSGTGSSSSTASRRRSTSGTAGASCACRSGRTTTRRTSSDW